MKISISIFHGVSSGVDEKIDEEKTFLFNNLYYN
jgi:hypothetical protein